MGLSLTQRSKKMRAFIVFFFLFCLLTLTAGTKVYERACEKKSELGIITKRIIRIDQEADGSCTKTSTRIVYDGRTIDDFVNTFTNYDCNEREACVVDFGRKKRGIQKRGIQKRRIWRF